MQKSFLLLLSSCCLFWTSSAFAQKNSPPSGQFGLGLYTASASGLGAPSGICGTFAINQHMQVGSLVSLGVASGEGSSSTTFEVAPFFRYQFDGLVTPFVQGGFAVFSSGGGTTASGMFFGGGIAYYLAAHFGIHADADILSLAFSPSGILFGWDNTRIGADWYF